MTEAAAVQATYSEIKMVKTRGVGQLILEFPLDQFAEVVKRLGVPMPGKERWVGLALLDELIASETERQKEIARETKSSNGKLRYLHDTEMGRARTRAALLSKDPEFWRWSGLNEAGSVALIRKRIGGSRSAIAYDPDAFAAYMDLEREFEAAIGRAAEVRA